MNVTSLLEELLTEGGMSYGGVILSGTKVLLRRPKGDYDGYVWTFAKGRPDPGETPEDAALREVYEETGFACQIHGTIGSFAGGTGSTLFYLMSGSKIAQYGWETQAIQWVELKDAHTWIEKTHNPVGRKRDLAVIEKVKQMKGIHA